MWVQQFLPKQKIRTLAPDFFAISTSAHLHISTSIYQLSVLNGEAGNPSLL
jgi:hypothetical protein